MSDKQKYIQYLQSRGKAVPDGLHEHVVIEFTENEDPIMTIIKSVMESFKQNNPEEYNDLTDDEKAEIAGSIYSYLISAAMAMVLDQPESTYSDPNFFAEAKEIEEIEELIAFMFVKSSQDEKVAEMFTKGLFTAYYDYCEKRELPTDPSYKEIVNK